MLTKDSLSSYFQEIAMIPRLTRKKETTASKKQLVEANLRLVVYFAKFYVDKGLHISDLIQEGNIGLMRAAKLFDRKSGFKFSTFSSWYIKRCMTRALHEKARTIRVPDNIYSKDPVERDEILALTETIYHDDMVYLNGKTMESYTPTTNGHNVDGYALKDVISKVLGTLSDEEREFIRIKFGVDDSPLVDGLINRGKKLSKNKGVAAEIERSAMNKLRSPHRARQLRPFLVGLVALLFLIPLFAQPQNLTGTWVVSGMDVTDTLTWDASAASYNIYAGPVTCVDPIPSPSTCPNFIQLNTSPITTNTVINSYVIDGVSRIYAVTEIGTTESVFSNQFEPMAQTPQPPSIVKKIISTTTTTIIVGGSAWLDELISQGF